MLSYIVNVLRNLADSSFNPPLSNVGLSSGQSISIAFSFEYTIFVE